VNINLVPARGTNFAVSDYSLLCCCCHEPDSNRWREESRSGEAPYLTASNGPETAVDCLCSSMRLAFSPAFRADSESWNISSELSDVAPVSAASV
jgi:hypothetical protein